jgi:NAD(P)-dependent dehydrogenase (short-subunit alcohol dehydrogenase family)/aryl carrier-like protein
MQQSRHIGKIVLSMRERPASIAPGEEPITLRDDATYLIAGGLGGFGLAVARWMIERGARHLVLLGRRGLHSPKAREAVAELVGAGSPRPCGARVLVRQADIAKENDLAAVLAEIDRDGPPLRGVVHAAMVLEDSLLLNLDRDLMRRVLAPKVSGAWNLHLQTLHHSLDFFILFSSLSSVFGHAGQGNYASANSFLDALAWYRRARGMPALTVNWGYLGEVGYLAQRRQLGERLEQQGVLSFTVREALTLLGSAMRRRATQISVMRVDWSRWRGLGVTGRVSPRFAHLLKQGESNADSRSARVSDPAALETLLRDKLARVLGTSPDRLDGEKPLLNLGLDSLMAVELRNWIEGELRVNLPIVELMRSPSLSRLAELLREQMASGSRLREPSGTGVAEAPPGSRVLLPLDGASSEDLLARIEDLPDEQVDELLTALLADKRRDRSTTP